MRPSPRRYGSRSPMLTVERGIDGDAQTKKTRTLRMNLVAEVKEDDNDKGDLHSDKEQEEAGTLKPPSLEIRTASPSPASSSRPTTPVDQEGRPSPVASSTSSPDRPLSVQRRAKYMRKPEGPMPLDPWCKHCPPVTADSWLPLKPDEVALVSETRDAMSRVQERPSRQAQPSKKMNGLSRAPTEGLGQAVLHNIQKPTSKIRAVFGDKQPRIQQFHFRMQQTAISCDIAPLVVKNMEEIELRPPMIRSRFSHELYGGPDVTVHWDVNQPKGQAPAASPSRGRGRLMRQDAACLNAGAAAVADTTPAPPVLRRLTTFQVSMLERFALNHVKQQLITASAIANAKNPTNARRANNTFKFGSIMQLLKGRKEGRLLSRTEMPKRVPPGGILTDRAAAQSTEAELMAAARFELGLEEDTTRSRWMPSPSVSEDLRLSRTSGPLGHLGMGLEMSSLDAKIRAANKSLDRVEVEHRSHVAYGYHIEDVAGNPAPASTVLAASPGSSVLMACGQLGLPSLHRQLAAKDPSTATPCEVGGEQQ
eukprot:TRINITY_DN9687_c0_g1_i3.p1 TRINITY_DN9687_c0_g1~~TRINITY_DN9687_c0_g1_i3.p1  ORF type:complete len:536 (-),score=91.95 TRINITY_DN9687_c0_g1_i3:85-1692(-)